MGDFNLKGILDMAQKRLDNHNAAMDAIEKNANRPSISEMASENNRKVVKT